MTITRRPSPFGELLSLRTAMDRLFEDSYVQPFGWASGVAGASMPLDVSTTAEELVVRAQLPGYKPDEVDISVENGTLAIRAETASETSEDEGDYLVREIRRGTVSRSVALPNGLQPDKAAATFEDGVLTLRIPKADEVKPRRIQISPITNGTTTQRAPAASDESRA